MSAAVQALFDEIRVIKLARMRSNDLRMQESDQWGRVARAMDRVKAEGLAE